MVLTKVLNQRLVDTQKIMDVVVTCLVVIGALFVPTFLAKIVPLEKYTQLVIGTIVNASLITTAIYTKGTFKTLCIATLPSISTILGGLLFANITLYSKFMIPAICLGNFSLIFIYKCLFVGKKTNYVITALTAIVIKVSIIYSGFILMTNLINVPEIAKQTLATSMGLTQLITASCGSLLVFFITLKSKKNQKNI